MIKGVIFDMDGVICHTNPFHSQAFKVFFERRKMFPVEEEFSQYMFGKSNSSIFSHYFSRPVSGDELTAFENEKETLFREIYGSQILEIPDFLPFLMELKENKIATAVATSAPRANMDLILTGLEITEDFESKLGSEDVSIHKPDPEIYNKSLYNLGLSNTDCVIFEDSFAGVTAGLNAGCKVIGVLSSHDIKELPQCHYYIDDYTEINLSLLEAILG